MMPPSEPTSSLASGPRAAQSAAAGRARAPEPGRRKVSAHSRSGSSAGSLGTSSEGLPHGKSEASIRVPFLGRLSKGRGSGILRLASFAAAALFSALLLVSTFALGSARADGGIAVRPKRVVTTFTIIEDIARNVAGDKAEVVSITKPGAEIHDYEPTPLDIVKAQSGDLVLWNGLGLERWFERFFQGLRNVPSVVVTEGIEPIGIAEGPYHGKPNPHAWMSPANALVYVENIRKALVAIDPENAATYDANAAAYSERIRALDGPMAETLAKIPADQRVLLSCEGAFSYLARNYGLKELYLWAINADEEGTPQQIRRVIDAVRKYDVPVAFCESTVSDKPMRQVVKETGIRFGGTLYVDSVTTEKGPAPTYLKLLEYNANLIQRGFDATN